MKKKSKLFVIAYFCVLAALALSTLLLPAKAFSENENRELQQFPALTAQSIMDGSFQSDLSDYLSDQIPGRDFWMQTNTVLKKLMGQRSINGVYLGKDGYYFQVFADSDVDTAWNAKKLALLEYFAQDAAVPVYLMPIPTPGVILKDKLPAHATMYDMDSAFAFLETTVPSCRFIDLRQTFAANASKDLYYRTDHHWTTMGAHVAYVQFCQSLGLTPKPLESFALEQVTDRFYGTIYSKTLDPGAKPDSIYAAMNLPQIQVSFDGEEASQSLYKEAALAMKDKYTYFLGGNHELVDIRTEAGNGRTLVILKDSFANCFVPYLLGDYEHIVMVDLRYYKGSVSELVEKESADEVLVLYEMTNLLTDRGIIKLG